MTVPNERTRAVLYTKDFLRDLLDPKKTPRVPKEIRQRAYRCLRHYPAWFDFLEASKLVPGVWGKPEEPDENA